MKIKCVLAIYDTLMKGGRISRREICAERKISARTFYRYMNDINEFLRENKPGFYVESLEPSGMYTLIKGEVSAE